jgi:secreted trypsin-like serine protease
MTRARSAAAVAVCLAMSASGSWAQTKTPAPSQADNQRIILGSPVRPGTYPFQVLVNVRKKNGSIYMCGGSLIGDSTWVLTAAHCVYDADDSLIPAWQFSISAGSVIYRQGNIISATEVRAFPSYNPSNHDGDFALIRLRTQPRAVSFGAIALLDAADENELTKADVPVTVIGWGKLETEKTSNRLMEGHARLVDRKQCNQNYTNFYLRGFEAYLAAMPQSGRDTKREENIFELLRLDDSTKTHLRQMLSRQASQGEVLAYVATKGGTIITDNMICALGSSPKIGGEELVSDACHGDSGGPLFMAGKDGKPTLVGVVSWGDGGRIGCGSPTEPGVYARVTKGTSWVNSIINK